MVCKLSMPTTARDPVCNLMVFPMKDKLLYVCATTVPRRLEAGGNMSLKHALQLRGGHDAVQAGELEADGVFV